MIQGENDDSLQIYSDSNNEIEINNHSINEIMDICDHKNTYNLRPRYKKQSVKSIANNSKKIIPRKDKVKRKVMNSASTFHHTKFLRKLNVDGEVFEVREVVLAKTRGWCHWPAIITEISGDASFSIHVKYFGTHEISKIVFKRSNKIKMIIKYEKGEDVIKENQLKYHGAYSDAVVEAALALKYRQINNDSQEIT